MRWLKWIKRFGGLGIIMSIMPLMANENYTTTYRSPELEETVRNQWVDSVYQAMTDAQRIGQLFMIRAHSDKTPAYEEDVANLIRNYHVGGLCFFQGTALRQAILTNYYQEISSTPLMIAMDAEWGLGMRLTGEGVMSFPKQIALGSIQDDTLIYQMGKEVARQLKRIGVHVNFAPVADINNNPNNPVINYRSFGEDREKVTRKSIAYMKGLHDGGVLACGKHFPGHGDTDKDSHYDLPVIRHSRERLDSIELYPFRELCKQGLKSIMVAHLSIPSLDDTLRRPTTLSHQTVTQLLRDEIGFDGLVFTDAMEMQAVTKYVKNGEAELEALLAGNDVILMPNHLPKAVESIKMALDSGLLDRTILERHVKRILRSKHQLNLDKQRKIELTGLTADLVHPSTEKLHAKLVEQSLIFVRNQGDLLPIKNASQVNIGCLNIGGSLYNSFQETLSRYGNLSMFQTEKQISDATARMWLDQLVGMDLVIVGLFDLKSRQTNGFGVTQSSVNFLKKLSEQTKVIIAHFGNPYGLRYFDEFDWVVQAHDEEDLTQTKAAQGIMGHYVVQGRMPVSASERIQSGSGFFGDNLLCIGYDSPANVGMSKDTLAKIDQLIVEMLDKKVTPGGQILVVKDRKVVYEKAFGHLSYDSLSPKVTMSTLYDLASITKVAATTLALMKLHEEGELSIFQPLGVYLGQARNTRKESLFLKDILYHQAGLEAWIPFYQSTLENGKPKSQYYSTFQQPGYQIQVAEGLWLKDEYKHEILRRLMVSPQKKVGGYVYSDLGFILLKEVVEHVTDVSFNDWLDDHFYRSLGLKSMGFHPRWRFAAEAIAPTEEDQYYRHQTVQGHVHDMAAAMFGGVSGHAGLFSNAHDLAVLFQMLLNGGYYGGRRYLRPETIRQFTTRCPDCPRRALGFDMKSIGNGNGHISPLASDRAFGHLGFTGTCVWADPEHDLIFIFLSNRTYPSMNSNKLQDGKYRQRIQTIVYQSMLNNTSM